MCVGDTALAPAGEVTSSVPITLLGSAVPESCHCTPVEREGNWKLVLAK